MTPRAGLSVHISLLFAHICMFMIQFLLFCGVEDGTFEPLELLGSLSVRAVSSAFVVDLRYFRCESIPATAGKSTPISPRELY